MFCYYLVIWRYKGVRHQTGQLSPACKCFRQDFSTNSSNIQSQLSRVWHLQREMWTPRSWVFCAVIVQWRWVIWLHIQSMNLKTIKWLFINCTLYVLLCNMQGPETYKLFSQLQFPPKSWLFSFCQLVKPWATPVFTYWPPLLSTKIKDIVNAEVSKSQTGSISPEFAMTQPVSTHWQGRSVVWIDQPLLEPQESCLAKDETSF